jgi:hypothetical protein
VPFKPKPGLEYRRLGDEGILLDPQSGKFYRLSGKAAACWEAVAGSAEHGLDPAALTELIAAGVIRGHRPERAGLPSMTEVHAQVAGFEAFTLTVSQQCDGRGGTWHWDPIAQKCVKR